jgi:hypothetical protein
VQSHRARIRATRWLCAPYALKSRMRPAIRSSARRTIRAWTPCANCPSRQHAARDRACRVGQITSTLSAIPRPCRGAFRDRHERWPTGCDGRGLSVRRSSRSRTEKSCGSGAPTLALSSQRRNRASCGRRGQESPVPGKSTKDTVKTVAQGRPVVRLVPVVTPPAFCLQADHGCGQHPAFPAPSRLRGRSLQQLGRKTRREKAGVWLFDIWIDVASVLGSRRVGWAKRSVPTIHDERAERRWARRKRAFAHPTKSRPGMTGE